MKSFLVLLLVIIFDFGTGQRASTALNGQSTRTWKTRHTPRANQSNSIEYYTNQNQAMYINIMIHMDPPLTMKLMKQDKYKTRQKLKDKSRKILKDVERFFQHRSLNQTIRFRLIDTKFLKNRSKIVRIDENASNYLKSYCNWQSGKKILNRKWYYSVLLTGLDLFYVDSRGEEVRRSTGRSYMASMCSMKRSCTLIEWHPTNIGFLLAHEIAHSLNINHDGPPFNHCGNNFVMSSKYDDRNHPKSWSDCSQVALKRFLQSGRSWCIRAEAEQ